jgi:hypothetical protein
MDINIFFFPLKVFLPPPIIPLDYWDVFEILYNKTIVSLFFILEIHIE